MCGICGVYNVQDGEPVSPTLVEQMTSLAAHWGPDDRGVYQDGNVGLGVVRLSIIASEIVEERLMAEYRADIMHLDSSSRGEAGRSGLRTGDQE